MGFYDLSKEKRTKIIQDIKKDIEQDLDQHTTLHIQGYYSNNDTYIRKYTCLLIRQYYDHQPTKQNHVLTVLKNLSQDSDVKVRQTVMHTCGEIGKKDAEKVFEMLESGLNDTHHSVRNAVIGALKQMGAKNPIPTLKFAKRFLHHQNPEVRREIIHGIELRGRTHPEDILPFLTEVQHDVDKKVQSYIVHVLGQISYKKGCLEKVIATLKTWENQNLVQKAVKEILVVHKRYEKFSEKTYVEANAFIAQNM
jgi:hypothetical protein